MADQEAIRRVNPQRSEMEHLTAIVHVDQEQHIIAGYKDVGVDEFWPTTPRVAFGNPGLRDGTPLAFSPCSSQRQ